MVDVIVVVVVVNNDPDDGDKITLTAGRRTIFLKNKLSFNGGSLGTTIKSFNGEFLPKTDVISLYISQLKPDIMYLGL